jgi:two-component system alkaline phosphatase synthesis response regulator PhoP
MGKQVLVLEDDVTMRRVIVTALRREGYIVYEEENGIEGDRRIRALKPDLVLLDVMLPGKTGLDICEDLKRDPDLKKIPVLLMTCLTTESKQDDSYWRQETGADDFITKPFPIGELLRRVQRMLS